MIIRRIKLKQFKNFIEKDEFFEPITFIKGKNGSGKTTLALESILFALYGYTPKESLKDLPTRNIAKSCRVELEVHHKGKGYRIIRAYPTKLIIFENNKELIFTNNTQAQAYITKTFGDRINFMKFRLIDAYSKESNFLEEGQTTLKKIIFSHSDEIFNNIRTKLNQIKYEREIWNKDKAVVYSHYPSEKRIQLISSKLQEINNQYVVINADLNETERDYINTEREISKLKEKKTQHSYQKDMLITNKKCYACERALAMDKQKQMLSEVSKKITELNDSLGNIISNSSDQKEIVTSYKQLKENLQQKRERLSSLKMKLENRIKQKDYKYSDRDVLIVKKAIGELDKLSSYYLTESIKVLEPIINNVLAKIEFIVSFTINDRNNFTINLEKEGINYKYKDLSCGEKTILQLAFKLALLLERGEEGIVIADEGLGSLDEENLLHMINIFQNFPFQLFLILHNAPELPESIKIIDLNEEE